MSLSSRSNHRSDRYGINDYWLLTHFVCFLFSFCKLEHNFHAHVKGKIRLHLGSNPKSRIENCIGPIMCHYKAYLVHLYRESLVRLACILLTLLVIQCESAPPAVRECLNLVIGFILFPLARIFFQLPHILCATI